MLSLLPLNLFSYKASICVFFHTMSLIVQYVFKRYSSGVPGTGFLATDTRSVALKLVLSYLTKSIVFLFNWIICHYKLCNFSINGRKEVSDTLKFNALWLSCMSHELIVSASYCFGISFTYYDTYSGNFCFLWLYFLMYGFYTCGTKLLWTQLNDDKSNSYDHVHKYRGNGNYITTATWPMAISLIRHIPVSEVLKYRIKMLLRTGEIQYIKLSGMVYSTGIFQWYIYFYLIFNF